MKSFHILRGNQLWIFILTSFWNNSFALRVQTLNPNHQLEEFEKVKYFLKLSFSMFYFLSHVQIPIALLREIK